MAVGFVAVGHRKPSGNVSGSAARDCRQSGAPPFPPGGRKGEAVWEGRMPKGNPCGGASAARRETHPWFPLPVQQSLFLESVPHVDGGLVGVAVGVVEDVAPNAVVEAQVDVPEFHGEVRSL